MRALATVLHPIFSALTSVQAPLPHASADSGKITIILDTVFTITGAISLLVITIAGFRYVISRGNPQAIAQARNTIIYAAVGLAITTLGFTIVTFVLNGI